MHPKIGIMILNQNGERWLPPLYDSIRKQNYPALKTYLVDNASSDSSVHLTEAHHPDVTVLKLSKNAGYCMAYNRTMPIAFDDGCEWVVWANNDVLLEPNCLFELAKVAARFEKVGVIGPGFICWDSIEANYYIKGNYPFAIPAMESGSEDPIDVPWVEGSFLMVSRKCVEDVGWLDPFLFFYWEETDFCRRALCAGWRVVLAPRAIARHFAGGWSAGDANNTNTANYLKSRNQYIYALADPRRSFIVNLLNGFHLFLVLLKAASKRSPQEFTYELRAFLRVTRELGAIYSKWHRDKKGLHPAATSPEYSDLMIELSDKHLSMS